MSNAKMDKEIKGMWVKALRSGKYTQGKHYLKRNGYCCLGVLAEECGILNPDGSINLPESPDWDYGKSCDTHLRNTSTLPYKVAKELNILKFTGKLMGMNDDDGKSFLEIADWIEENL